jgi:hypothetical protein
MLKKMLVAGKVYGNNSCQLVPAAISFMLCSQSGGGGVAVSGALLLACTIVVTGGNPKGVVDGLLSRRRYGTPPAQKETSQKHCWEELAS